MTDNLINTEKGRDVQCASCQALFVNHPYGPNIWCPFCGNYLLTVVKRAVNKDELVTGNSPSTPES